MTRLKLPPMLALHPHCQCSLVLVRACQGTVGTDSTPSPISRNKMGTRWNASLPTVRSTASVGTDSTRSLIWPNKHVGSCVMSYRKLLWAGCSLLWPRDRAH